VDEPEVLARVERERESSKKIHTVPRAGTPGPRGGHAPGEYVTHPLRPGTIECTLDERACDIRLGIRSGKIERQRLISPPLGTLQSEDETGAMTSYLASSRSKRGSRRSGA
jgi:hypothetical protein